MSTPEPYWYLASYPKSGNTWCRLVISALREPSGVETEGAPPRSGEHRELWPLATGAIVSSRYWLDDQLGIDSSDLCWAELDRLRGRVGHQHPLHGETSRYHKVHDAFTSPDSAGQPVVPVKGCAGAVVLIRHPADVAVSLSAFYAWDLERCVAFLLDERAALCPATDRGGDQVRQFLGPWSDHVSSWVDQRRVPVLALRYEDLLEDPQGRFSQLARFLGLPAEPRRIAAAVERTRFATLREREEREGGFPERPRTCGRFFRSGRRGEGRERLTEEQWERLRARFGETLQRWGYGDSAPPG
ncbi:MAG: sulfotransferase domain-containing protein [Cyanobacteriota bacterium]|nr:sulfotransferase domain-containing protein [Cyanobacteriota bacterium]